MFVYVTRSFLIINTRSIISHSCFKIDCFNPINLTGQVLTEDELNVCKLGLKLIPTVKRYDRVKKLMDIEAFKRKVRLFYFHELGSDETSILSEG